MSDKGFAGDVTDAGWKWRMDVREAALGVPASAVAEAAGIAPSSYKAFKDEDGEGGSIKTAKAVEEALGVPAGWLFNERLRSELAMEAATFKAPAWVRERKEARP